MREVIRHEEFGLGAIWNVRFAIRDGMDEMLLWIRWNDGEVPAGWYWWDDPKLQVNVLALARSM